MDLKDVQHTDKCCSWDDPEFCDCGATSYAQQNAIITDLRAALTAAREENDRLTAENANLRAATRGKTFFHSDEEVNAEMGRRWIKY